MTTFVFDIETIPDVKAGRQLLSLTDVSDQDVATAMAAQQKEKSGHTFIRQHLQQIVAISVVLSNREQFSVWSLGNTDSDEAELISRFFAGLTKTCPTLVSWNGSGFDLPVIHYRALLHGIPAPAYWETGEQHAEFRWNNYLNRYHQRHCDLMDVLSGYQARAYAPLNDIATMLGFPGKCGMDGSHVWPAYRDGNLQGIRDYCETDVVNTYLVYCRYQLLRGAMNQEEYQNEIERIQATLTGYDKPHWQEFLSAWT